VAVGAPAPIAVARQHTLNPMGQGNADAALVAAFVDLDGAQRVRDFPIVGLRDSLAGAARLPIARISRWPAPVQRVIGRGLYRRFELVHRLDLRLPPAPAPEVLTVYDLAPMRFDDEGAFPHSALSSVRRAAAVICPSQFSAGELTAWSGRGDVDVIALGVDPACFAAQAPSGAERTAHQLPARWVLHAGGVTARKNLAQLAAAWPAVHSAHPDTQLLLCGPEDPRRSALFADVPGTRLLGRVARPLLLTLLAGAAAVVVPSIYEGYGLPVQEAMAVGVPAVVVASASLPEVAGPGTTLVPDDPAALADGLISALAGVSASILQAGRAEARTRSWEAAARAHLAVYERVLHGPAKLHA
jgi:glycosyltransferase involved in cell wall biosynthesis